ncbi:MAG: DEAD/DEAH box helicase [Actinobacteria bacterium]|nr:DEAD/DEAH box helicase [Actinomycetota bacterium]
MKLPFADLGVPTDLVERLTADGITDPFPIQTLTLADALAGRDLCGRAPTGAGKTLAFAIPLAALAGRARSGRPRALVLVPTRELAAQVAEAVRPLAEVRQRRVATFYGGTDLRRDLRHLARGVDIIVATPGRLADLVRRNNCDLSDVDLVVVDEADRMADMGFLPEVKRLLDRTSNRRQTLLFSATLDGDVDELVRRYQNEPVRRHVEPEEDLSDVRHVFWLTERHDRRGLTADIVRRSGPAIVFTRTKHGADRLAKQLSQAGISTAAIHGDRNQRQRERALADFTEGRVTTLVATDVAARGIHVDAVGVVIHYDLPRTDKDYLHRSGRTGRAGAAGLVVSLVAGEQRGTVDRLQRTLQLPRGLHQLDLDLITTGAQPAPSTSREGQSHQRVGRDRTTSTPRRRSNSNRTRGGARGPRRRSARS